MFKNNRVIPNSGVIHTVSNDRQKTLSRQSGISSIISADMVFHGNLQSTGDLQVEGTVVGEIDVAKLIIADGASVSGNVVAQDVRVCGSLTGSIRGAMVTLTSTARVVGDIYHELLAIETGGQIDGQCRRLVPGAQDLLATESGKPALTETGWGKNRDTVKPGFAANGHDQHATA
jgi:cytoskeletal protein CcmA (bactofilin family)